MKYNREANEAAKRRIMPLFVKVVSESWRKTRARAMPGFVYLFAGGGVHKIVKAVDVRDRLGDIAVTAPFPVRLVHFIATDHMDKLEEMLHCCFKAAGKHVHNEWFDLDEQDVQTIIELGAEVNQSQFEVAFQSIRRRVAALAAPLDEVLEV